MSMRMPAYLPDITDFEYVALAPWPSIDCPQQDWIMAYHSVETWLNTQVGPHWVRWAWSTVGSQTSRDCCVRFRYAPDRTLFLLRWAG